MAIFDDPIAQAITFYGGGPGAAPYMAGNQPTSGLNLPFGGQGVANYPALSRVSSILPDFASAALPATAGTSSMWQFLLPAIISAAGSGMGAASAASQANQQRELSEQQLQFERDKFGLQRGPSPQMMKLVEMLSSNFNPVTYTPGQGYSAPSVFNMPAVLQGLQGVVGPDAQQKNISDFKSAQQRVMEGPSVEDQYRMRMNKMAASANPKVRRKALEEGYEGFIAPNTPQPKAKKKSKRAVLAEQLT